MGERNEEGVRWRLRLAGVPQLEGAALARPVRLERKLAGLLAYLALGGPAPRQRLVELLWPGATRERARNSLRQTLHRLRELSGGELVEGDRSEARLAPGVALDVREPQGGAGGELLAGCDYADCPDFDAWVQGQRQWWAGTRRRAVLDALQALEARGELQAALARVEAELARAPDEEEWYRRGMRLYFLLGDRGAGLGLYARCVRVLEDTLGARPSEETRALAAHLERAGALPPAVPRPRERLPVSVLRPPVLAGREREWEQLERAWDAGQLIYLEGEAGVGKSRLARDFAASRGAVRLLEARPGDRDVPYASAARFFRRQLAERPEVLAALSPRERRELARILPEVADPAAPPPPLRSEGERLAFLDALADLQERLDVGLSTTVVDDAHYMDLASGEFGTYFMSRGFPAGRGNSLSRFVDCYRTGELTPEQVRLQDAQVDAGMAVVVRLGPLAPEGVARLLDGLDVPGAARLAPQLARYTGGNPLFVVETVKHLLETGGLERGWPERLPPPGKVAPLIQRRLERLGPLALQLVHVAALAGTAFELALAAEALEVPLLSLGPALQELEAAQVLRDGRFTHDLVAEAVKGSLSRPLALAVHRRLAALLEARGAPPAEVARHWLAAEEGARAVPLLLRAVEAEEAARRFTEAQAHLLRAADVLEEHGRRAEAEACRARAGRLAQA